MLYIHVVHIEFCGLLSQPAREQAVALRHLINDIFFPAKIFVQCKTDVNIFA